MVALINLDHPPFDLLSPLERERLQNQADIEFFPAGSTVMARNSSVDSLFVVIKGLIHEYAADELRDTLAANAVFDARAVVTGIASARFEAEEDSIVGRLPRAAILALTQSAPLFGAFFYHDIARRMATLAQRPLQQQAQSLMLARVHQACVSAPVWQDANATVLDAAKAMQTHHATSVLVRAGERIGFFTQSDLRNFVIEGLQASAEALSHHAQYRLHTVDEDDFLFQAMLTMTRHEVQRVIVTRHGEVTGVLEQVELLSYLSNHSHIVSARIERAQSVEELQQAASSMDKLVELLHGNGSKVRLIAELVSALHLKLLARLYRLLAPPEVLAHTCLVVLGSEGRGEQILKTDQDNALLIEDGYDHPALPELANQFNEQLNRLGYPLCPGEIMVRNPRWRLSTTAFQQQIGQWIDAADGAAVMNLAILADAQAVCGNTGLLEQTQAYLQRNLNTQPAFLARFALAVEQFDPPGGMLGRLLNAGSATAALDLKKAGIFPIVHGLRSLALEAGLSEQNSYARLQALQQTNKLEPQLAADLQETLTFLQGLHLQHGLQQVSLGQSPDYLIRPDLLGTLQRELLKDALSVVKRFRQLLRHHFHLDSL